MADAPAKVDHHEDLMALLKRRGYLAPSYEIYGGVAGFYDYGPLGAAMKQNLQNLWRSFYVLGEGMSEIECPTIAPEGVFRASGHLEKFADTVVECPECGAGHRGDHLVRNEWARFRDITIRPLATKNNWANEFQLVGQWVQVLSQEADRDASPSNIRALLDGKHRLWTDQSLGPRPPRYSVPGATIQLDPGGVRVVTTAGKTLVEDVIRCPACGKPLDMTKTTITAFNLMFKTNVGPGSGRAGYLRPETAQGMFVDFDWLYEHHRKTLPFGAVQIGKAYRNEISPRQAVLRLREFSQMEAEVFFDPKDKRWHDDRYKALAARELNLLVAGHEKVQRIAMGVAVEKKIIANSALGYFIALTDKFLEAAGLPRDIVRFRQHEPTEKAHYSTDTWDAEFLSPRFDWVEIVGIADRTDYDLKAHERVSGVELRAFRRYDQPREEEREKVSPVHAKLGPRFKQKAAKIAAALEAMDGAKAKGKASLHVAIDGETVEVPAECFEVKRVREVISGESFTPHVVEPSYGVDRILYAVLESAYAAPAPGEKDAWVRLKLAPAVAPVKAGVFPLFAKDGLDAEAFSIDRELRAAGIATQYDDSGSIGKRYARADESGTPWCVTVDYESLEGETRGTVTIRDRDTGGQRRVKRSELPTLLRPLP